MSIENEIENYIAPHINEMGYIIVRVKYMRKTQVLQIMLEKSNGKSVDIDDCEKASKEISVLLDVLDPIKDQYSLEVSSTGINRPLVKIDDYVRFCGSNVVISTYKKKFSGQLIKADANTIQIKLKGTNNIIDVSPTDISNAYLDFNI